MLLVDRICINQEDIAQRNYQMSHMREIYSSSKRVVIWLGEGGAETRIAFQFLKQMAAACRKSKSDNEYRDPFTERTRCVHSNIPNLRISKGVPMWAATMWAAMVSLLCQELFRRV